jgi:hypothetical protein
MFRAKVRNSFKSGAQQIEQQGAVDLRSRQGRKTCGAQRSFAQ